MLVDKAKYCWTNLLFYAKMLQYFFIFDSSYKFMLRIITYDILLNTRQNRFALGELFFDHVRPFSCAWAALETG